ncbi:MAG: hypothetical protein HY704_09315 [Gemmatimonadetes bacterium]|nr:hypothetical protein [Gemmatimonadota bacterium]
MQILPIDVVSLVSAFMGILVVLIPIAGLTLRFALKPFVESLGRWMEARGAREEVELVSRRVAFLEQQLESVEATVQRLAEATEFDRQLRASQGRPPQREAPALPTGSPR